jgi:hypothetical protein
MVLRNEDVTEILAEIPEGHRHLRTEVTLADGSSITLQEATVAAIARAGVQRAEGPCPQGRLCRVAASGGAVMSFRIELAVSQQVFPDGD